MAKYYVHTEGRLGLEIEDAKLKYSSWHSNWSGRTDGVFHYNSVDRETGEGQKYFTVVIPAEFTDEVTGKTMTVDDLASMGIPIKTYPGDQEKGYDEEHTLRVRVSFKFRPPIVQLDMGGDIIHYGKDEVHRLDQLMVNNIDLVLGFGKVNPDTGRRPCYLNEYYASAVTSRMALKHKQKIEDDDDFGECFGSV